MTSPRHPPARARALIRSSVAATVVIGSTLVASPAFASNRDDGDDPGAGLSTLEVLWWFVGLPLLIIAVVALLVYAPSIARGPRQRPGPSWSAGPVWFNGPTDGDVDAAIAAATPTTGGGGTSARW
ncbi:MAG: hypothetical protein ABWZ26_02525 [Candidatus Nanopelagicales bacterium]